MTIIWSSTLESGLALLSAITLVGKAIPKATEIKAPGNKRLFFFIS